MKNIRSTIFLSLLLVLIIVVGIYVVQQNPTFIHPRILPLWILLGCVLGGVAISRLFAFEFRAVNPNFEQKNFSVAFIFVVIVFCLGVALRFYGLRFGLPENYHPDEVPKVNAVMRMVQYGDLNPRYFLHPSLLLYCTYFMNTILRAVGILDGSFQESAFLAGRIVSAIAGSLSILLIFFLARRLYGDFVGFLSATFLAVVPIHVTCSRYLKEDALLVFFILATALSVVKAVQDRRTKYLYLAGFLAGATFSTKYSGMFAFLFLAAAPWYASRSWMPDRGVLKSTILALSLVPIGFVMFSPYVALDSAKFIKDFNSERAHMLRGHTVSVDAWSQFWMYHFGRSIIPGMTLFTTVICSLGLGLLLWRRRLEDLMILSAILLFYLPAEWVKAKPAPQPERYILPCIPFLAVAGAAILERLMRVNPRVFVPVIFLSLAVPFVRAAQLAGEVGFDSRQKMKVWLEENIEDRSRIMIDWKPYSPQLNPTKFDVTYMPRDKIIPALDITALRESGQDYLLLSSLFYDRYFTEPGREAILRERIRGVFERVPIIKQITPDFGTYGFHNPTLTLFSLKAEDFVRLNKEIVAKREGKLDATSNEALASFRWKASAK